MEENIKNEIASLAAETMALQFLFVSLCQQLGEAAINLRTPITKAFDNAADMAENFSLAGGRHSGHLPETLRIIEQLRATLLGQSKPKREV